MRIAYITQSYPPMVSGAATVARHIAENMAARGHSVLVLAASDRGESYKSINGNLMVIRMRSFHNPNRVDGRVALFPRGALMQGLRDFHPDVIHTHDVLQLGMLALLYKRTQDLPILVTAHALPNFAVRYLPASLSSRKENMERYLWKYARWILHQFDAVTTPTQTTSATIFAMTKIQPYSISNGVDLERFTTARLRPHEEAALRYRLGLPQQVPVILHVGRLDVDKNVDRVITAASIAMSSTNAHLVLVGDGCQKPALQELCRSMGIESRCHFPGYITVEQGLPEIYRLANLFITASEIETQGIVLLEAAASGLPIAAVRATCIHEIVHDGVNGYLVEPGDVFALSEAITALLLDEGNARRMGEAGRQLAKCHDIHATLDSYEQLYVDLVRQYAIQRRQEHSRHPQWQKRAREWLKLYLPTNWGR